MEMVIRIILDFQLLVQSISDAYSYSIMKEYYFIQNVLEVNYL